MKIKDLALGMMACAALAACSNEDLVENNTGKLEGGAYVAINIVTPTSTSSRAAGDFEPGVGEESDVKSATFIFYDVNGNVCEYKEMAGNELEWMENPNDNVEKITTPVLLLNPVNGVIPASVIVVLNAPFNEDDSNQEKMLYQTTPLSRIKQMTGARDYTGDGILGQSNIYSKGFVMSNSAYAKGDQTVVEVPLTLDNLATSPELAKESPVVIPVERLVAKVEIERKATESEMQTVLIGGKEVSVKTVITGWKATATNLDAYLLKQIDVKAYNENFSGWNWNDETNVRSYWGKSVELENPASKSESYRYYSYNDAVENKTNNVEYCFENTSAPFIQLPDYSTATKLWVVAQLQTSEGEPLSLMQWKGVNYLEEGLKAYLVNALKKYYYLKSGNLGEAGATYESILPSHLTFVPGSKPYSVKATLAGDTKFYTLDGNKKPTDATQALSNELTKLPDALYWKDGMTYYYTNINHTTCEKGQVCGVVRNHVYHITINSITGLGTPIFDPDQVIDPEKPSGDKSYVAAQVEVLKWKIVNQTVDLK